MNVLQRGIIVDLPAALKVPESLGKLQWLYHNALLLFVISDFGVSGQWEVLSEWMPIKSVISHDTSQIRMTNEEYSKQVIDLTLIPVRTIVQTSDARDRLSFVRVGLHPYPRVVSHTEHIINHFKPLVS